MMPKHCIRNTLTDIKVEDVIEPLHHNHRPEMLINIYRACKRDGWLFMSTAYMFLSTTAISHPPSVASSIPEVLCNHQSILAAIQYPNSQTAKRCVKYIGLMAGGVQ